MTIPYIITTESEDGWLEEHRVDGPENNDLTEMGKLAFDPKWCLETFGSDVRVTRLRFARWSNKSKRTKIDLEGLKAAILVDLSESMDKFIKTNWPWVAKETK